MRVFFDTEFIDDGKTIELLSIGMIREDGKSYYAEPLGPDYGKADAWVLKNVIPHLMGGVAVKPRAQIASEIIDFAGKDPEFWAYYADYDWVVLCQLYGRMVDLPPGWPKFCRDLKQLCVMLGNPHLPKQIGVEHNALEDAIWVRESYKALMAPKFTARGLLALDDREISIKAAGGAGPGERMALITSIKTVAMRAAQAEET